MKEVVQTVGHLSIINLYANVLYTQNDSKTGEAYYGDVYTNKEELLKEHPACEVLQGFGLLDHQSGFAPDDSEDWYESLEDALSYIEKRE